MSWLQYAESDNPRVRKSARTKHAEAAYQAALREFDIKAFDHDHPGVREAVGIMAEFSNQKAHNIHRKLEAGIELSAKELAWAKAAAEGENG